MHESAYMFIHLFMIQCESICICMCVWCMSRCVSFSCAAIVYRWVSLVSTIERVHTCVYVYVHVCMYMQVYTCTCIRAHIWMYMFTNIPYTYTYICVCMAIDGEDMCICIYLCVSMQTHIVCQPTCMCICMSTCMRVWYIHCTQCFLVFICALSRSSLLVSISASIFSWRIFLCFHIALSICMS